MADANGNGRGTVQRIWDILVDPEDGMTVKLTRMEEGQKSMHSDVVKLQTDVDILKAESQRRAGARKLGNGLWAAVIALLTLTVAILGLMYSTAHTPAESANHETELTIKK